MRLQGITLLAIGMIQSAMAECDYSCNGLDQGICNTGPWDNTLYFDSNVVFNQGVQFEHYCCVGGNRVSECATVSATMEVREFAANSYPNGEVTIPEGVVTLTTDGFQTLNPSVEDVTTLNVPASLQLFDFQSLQADKRGFEHAELVFASGRDSTSKLEFAQLVAAFADGITNFVAPPGKIIFRDNSFKFHNGLQSLDLTAAAGCSDEPCIVIEENAFKGVQFSGVITIPQNIPLNIHADAFASGQYTGSLTGSSGTTQGAPPTQGGGATCASYTCQPNTEHILTNCEITYASDPQSECCQDVGGPPGTGGTCGGGGGGGPQGGGGGSGSAADGDSCSSNGDCAAGLECLNGKGCVPAAMNTAMNAFTGSDIQSGARDVSFDGQFTGKSSAAKAALRRTIVKELKSKSADGARNHGIRVPFADLDFNDGAGKTFISNLLASRTSAGGKVTMRAPKNKDRGAPGISPNLDQPSDCVKADFTDADTEVIECVHTEDGDECLRCTTNTVSGTPISLTTYSGGSYTYQCHDGSTWGSATSVSVGDTYSCTVGGQFYESAIFSETGGGGSTPPCIEVGQRVQLSDGTHKNVEHLVPGDMLRTPSGFTKVRSTRRGARHLSTVHDVSCNGMTGSMTGEHAYQCDGEWRLPKETHGARSLQGTTEVVAIETDNYCEDRMLLESGLEVETWDGRGVGEWRPHAYENGRRLRCTLKGSWRDHVLQRVDSEQ